MISHKITKHSKPFSDAEFIKDCLVVSAKIGIKKEVANENVTISRQNFKKMDRGHCRKSEVYSWGTVFLSVALSLRGVF